MKQSRLASFAEAVGNTLSGFFISLFAQWLILPLLGVPITLTQNIAFAVIMTGVSIARSFAWRRLMEALHVRDPISPFMRAVMAERRRQVEVEGWDAAHDDKHPGGELAAAGACYAMADRPVVYRSVTGQHAAHALQVAGLWPWELEWWKPKLDRRRNLVVAAALILAEGERLDRNRAGKRRPLQGGYQPAGGGDRPPAPMTGSGVVLAHGKTPSRHSGTSEGALQ